MHIAKICERKKFALSRLFISNTKFLMSTRHGKSKSQLIFSLSPVAISRMPSVTDRNFDYSFFQPTELSWNANATLSLHLVKMKKRCECPKLGKNKYR